MQLHDESRIPPFLTQDHWASQLHLLQEQSELTPRPRRAQAEIAAAFLQDPTAVGVELCEVVVAVLLVVETGVHTHLALHP